MGTLRAVLRRLMANRAPTAWARLSGEITSEIAPTALGGRVPAPRPVSTLRTKKVSMLGAKADAITETQSNSIPARATGRRPNESDSGPTDTTDSPHAAKVAVAN